jgi:hypothetical protein
MFCHVAAYVEERLQYVGGPREACLSLYAAIKFILHQLQNVIRHSVEELLHFKELQIFSPRNLKSRRPL